jgi:hypothetical protein
MDAKTQQKQPLEIHITEQMCLMVNVHVCMHGSSAVCHGDGAVLSCYDPSLALDATKINSFGQLGYQHKVV